MSLTAVREFGMNNAASVLLTPPGRVITTLARNVEFPAPGITAKRRGFSVSLDPTTDFWLRQGATAPHKLFPWKFGATAKLVSIGADACGFINSTNNYFYLAYDSTGTVRSIKHVAGGLAVNIDTAWGLDAPVSVSVDRASGSSLFGLGGYAVGVVAYDDARKLESAITMLPNVAGGESDQVIVLGWGYKLVWPTLTADSNASHIRYYRTRLTSIGKSTGWIAAKVSDLSHLRMLDQKAVDGSYQVGTWDDVGNQAESRLYNYSPDVMPLGYSVAFHGGRYFFTRFYDATRAYQVIFSNAACPETYAGNERAILDEPERGLVQGQSILLVPNTAGPVTGIVAFGDNALVLCQRGCFRIFTLGSGLYGIANDSLGVGCVSDATIAYGQEGVYWLDSTGVVLWDGRSAPMVLTRNVVDTAASDTAFATDLSAACGCYDADNRQYLAVVPKSGGGQFILCVKGDRLPDNLPVSVWTLSDTMSPITGMGYDWVNRRVVIRTDAGGEAYWAQAAGTYIDGEGKGGTGTYAAALAMAWGFNEAVGRGDNFQRPCPAMTLYVHRTDVTTAQALSVTVRGLQTSEPASGEATAVTLTPTWAISQRAPKPILPQSDLRGRGFIVTMTNTDAKPFEWRELQIGEPESVLAVQGVR